MCPCGQAIDDQSHIVRDCEIYREEWDVLAMRNIDECGMEKVWYTR